MDFIEKLLGLSLDGGSGATELALIVVPFLLILLIWLHSSAHTKRNY